MLIIALFACALGQSLDGYYSYDEVLETLEELSDSEFVHGVHSIGQTRSGNDINYIHIEDNDGIENRPGILLVGGVAAEPMSVTAAIMFAQRLVSALELGTDDDLKFTAKTTSVYILPVLNVDTYADFSEEYPRGGEDSYRSKNLVTTDCDDPDLTGVSLDRNFAFKWAENDVGSSDDPCSEIYRGRSEFSENETEFLRDAFDDKDIALVVVIQGPGKHLVHPYTYSNTEYLREGDETLFAEMANALPDYSISGLYEATQQLANGSLLDYFYSQYSKAIAIYPGEALFEYEDAIDSNIDDVNAFMDLAIRYAGVYLNIDTQPIPRENECDRAECISLYALTQIDFRFVVENRGLNATQPMEIMFALEHGDLYDYEITTAYYSDQYMGEGFFGQLTPEFEIDWEIVDEDEQDIMVQVSLPILEERTSRQARFIFERIVTETAPKATASDMMTYYFSLEFSTTDETLLDYSVNFDDTYHVRSDVAPLEGTFMNDQDDDMENDNIIDDEKDVESSSMSSGGNNDDDDEMDGGMVAFVVILSIILFLIVVVIIYYSCKACRRKEDTKTLMDRINQESVVQNSSQPGRFLSIPKGLAGESQNQSGSAGIVNPEEVNIQGEENVFQISET